MSNFKLEFTLQQHTPLIHFQSDQKGATLRATELKPKLDRFLIKELDLTEIVKINDKDKEVPKKEYKSWFIGEGKEHLALDYKVNIQQNGISEKYHIFSFLNKNQQSALNEAKLNWISPAPYFAQEKEYKNIFKEQIGNNGETIKDSKGKSLFNIDSKELNQITKCALFTKDEISVSVKSLNIELLKKIKDKKYLFFASENFGARQSKGFGSFYIAETTINNFEIYLKKQFKNRVFKLKKSKDIWQTIDLFYKHIKMGQRENKFEKIEYDRSLLFQYMCNEYNIGWEKKYLKVEYPEIIHGSHKPIVCKKPKDKEYKYIRALLGLAEHNEYRPNNRKKQIKIESVDRNKDDKTKAKYQRLKSPIIFKIFEENIYIVFNENYKQILNKEFYFRLNGEERKLYTPERFDMYDFLKFVTNKIDDFKELT